LARLPSLRLSAAFSALTTHHSAFIIVVAALLARPGPAAGKPVYRVLKHISLDIRTEKPTFVCLEGIDLLDRGRLAWFGRPLENRSSMFVLDLKTMEERLLLIPDIPGPWIVPKDLMVMDRPLFHDTENGTAGLLLRMGGVVSGDAEYAEWDLKADRLVRRLPLAAVKGGPWLSVRLIGYDPAKRECFIEVVRPAGTGVEQPGGTGGGPYELTVLAVTDKVRTVASFKTKLRYTSSSPYFDPLHRRSMHVEYNEYKGAESFMHLVDLDTGAVRDFPIPPVVYGFAFDPDGKTGYVYSHTEKTVYRLDLETGKRGKSRVFGQLGHVLDFIAPNMLVLGRNAGMHFIDSRTLAQKDFLPAGDFHKGSTHLEGSIFMPGRALVRIFYDLYVLEFPDLLPK
jgi:hypothetical protein